MRVIDNIKYVELEIYNDTEIYYKIDQKIIKLKIKFIKDSNWNLISFLL
jgi:hypothetical protein